MLKVIVIGSGNVAQHLIKVLETSAHTDLVQAFARHPEKLYHLLNRERIVDAPEALTDADVYILSVSDDAIEEMSSLLPFNNRLVVHTSGSAAIDLMNGKNRRGVFYPVQTFSKNKDVDFSSVPICIESEYPPDYSTIRQLANTISESVHTVTSRQRQVLHVAAVFVSNFTNHMYTIGNSICDENHISFDILKPLIIETADKIKTLQPQEAQTGPAKRNDITTIDRHLDLLEGSDFKEIYTVLTKSIQKEDVNEL